MYPLLWEKKFGKHKRFLRSEQYSKQQPVTDRTWLYMNAETPILDIGCGNCIDANHFKNYIGVDITLSFLKSAKKHYNVHNVLRCDGRALPFKDKSFKTSYAKDTLHHYGLDDALKFLEEMTRVSETTYVAWGKGFTPSKNPEIRKRKGFYYNRFDIEKLKKHYYVSYVGMGTTITQVKNMKDVKFYGESSIKENVTIGEGTGIGEYVVIGANAKIGKNCRILYHVTICKDAVIGDNVFIGPNTTLLNDKYPPSKISKPPIIGDNAVIGGGVTLLPNIQIGEGAVVGAGSVVTKNVDPYSVAFGNPAKTTYSRMKYNEKKEGV